MSDGAAIGLRIGRELLGAVRERAFAAALARRDGIPADVAGIDAAWLEDALSDVFPGARVAGIEHLGGDAGTTTRARLGIRYAGDAGGAPGTVFAKLTPSDTATRVFNALMGLGRTEVAFYRTIRPSVPIAAPRAWCARAAPRGARFVLLLEDLSDARFASVDAPVGLDDARNVMRMLGALHASLWESPRLERDWTWLRSVEHNPNLPLERWISARSHEPCIRRYGELLPDVVRRRAGDVHANRDALEAFWSRGPRTLIHGDSHAGNMFFRDDAAGLLDWQVTQRGQGIRDVGYFLMNSVEVALRREHERALVDLWIETLREHGVPPSDLAPDDLWERYRSQSFYVWIASSVTASMARLQPETVKRRALERASAALLDHDAFALLDRIARGRGPV